MTGDFDAVFEITEYAGHPIISARALHDALGIKKKFADWFKYQAEKAGLLDGREYFPSLGIIPPGGAGRPSSDYLVTLDAVKHLCLMSQSKKAREIRAYFIEAEHRFRALQKWATGDSRGPAVPEVMPNEINGDFIIRLGLELKKKENQIQSLKMEKAELAPKAEAFDDFIGGRGYFSMAKVAKMLDTGRNRLFEDLRAARILMADNTPYQKYVDAGYFALKPYTIKPAAGGRQAFVGTVTLVAPKGVDYLRRLRKEKDPNESTNLQCQQKEVE